jgi:hypothetical protein
MNLFLERLIDCKSRLERVARRIWHPAPMATRREVQLEFPWVLKK